MITPSLWIHRIGNLDTSVLTATDSSVYAEVYSKPHQTFKIEHFAKQSTAGSP